VVTKADATSEKPFKAKFRECLFYALKRIASGIVSPMSSHDFLSEASVVMLLSGVALLAVASAVTLAPFNKLSRSRGIMFMVCLTGIWAVAVLVIWLIKRTF
jgi:hypothetical protein